MELSTRLKQYRFLAVFDLAGRMNEPMKFFTRVKRLMTEVYYIILLSYYYILFSSCSHHVNNHQTTVYRTNDSLNESRSFTQEAIAYRYATNPTSDLVEAQVQKYDNAS